MYLEFEKIYERDMDLFLMRQLATDIGFLKKFFVDKVFENISESELSVLRIGHSVMTSDGESDIEVLLQVADKKIMLLIEDKIDAIAQPQQSDRYLIRGKKSVADGNCDEFYVFIVAPLKYLEGNTEAKKYSYKLSFEEIRESLNNPFDVAIINKALVESKSGYIPVEDKQVTEFWKKLYDYIDERYPNVFNVYGKKDEVRGAKAQWITFSCGKNINIQIKSDKGYVDLQIAGWADKAQQFLMTNQELLDSKKLYLRIAGKSLAIRMYTATIDFTKAFEEQKDEVEEALKKAYDLQNLVKYIKF